MDSNSSQNATANQEWRDQLWTYVFALSPLLGVFLVTAGNLLVIIDIHRKTLRSLTFDLLVQLLICDIFLVVLLQLVSMTSILTKLWDLDDTFCLGQGMAIQVVSMLSCFLRMVLAFERLSVSVRQQGMKISRGTGLMVSFIFLGIAVLIALFPKEKRNQYLFLEDFHSCYLGGEWIPVSTNLAVLPAPCFIIVIVSLMSFYNPLLYKTAVVVPADVSYASNSVIVPRRQMMYLESTNPPSNRKMSIVSDFNIPPDSVNSENIYEMKTAPHLPLFNTILTGMIIIRLCLMVASRHVPTGESIQTTILVCFVLRIYIQTIFLLITSFRSRKAIQSLNFKPQSSMEKHMSVRKGQSLPLVPRDDFAYMPDFLKQPSDMDINVHVVQSSDSVRSVKRVSFPLAAVTSSFDLDPRTANDLARRRVTISVI